MKKIISVLTAVIFFSSCHKENNNNSNQELPEERATISAKEKDQPSYQFQSLDVPSEWGDNTSAFGNNNAGKIVGNYVTKNQEVHGFVFDNGQFTDVFLPEADKNNRGMLADINDGDISIGSFNYPKNTDHDQVVHSFIRDANGAINVLPDPIAGALLTEATGINNSGTIIGFYHDANSSRHGFIFNNGVHTTYDKPGAARTLLMGINNQGKIVGFYRDANGIGRGFTLIDGVTEDIVFPGAVETRPHGINKTGLIVGEYIDNAGTTHGFLLQNGRYSKLNFPGSFDTALFAINDDGVITGTYNGFSHGLIATPN